YPVRGLDDEPRRGVVLHALPVGRVDASDLHATGDELADRGRVLADDPEGCLLVNGHATPVVRVGLDHQAIIRPVLDELVRTRADRRYGRGVNSRALVVVLGNDLGTVGRQVAWH